MSCGANIVNELTQGYNVTLYFYNPSIFPLFEYNKRLNETIKIAKEFNYKLIIADYDHKYWEKIIKGFELEAERGERCKICYHDRLQKTRDLALTMKFDYFTTTLTVSPHKDSKTILNFGLELVKDADIKFLNKDFKKDDGFKKAVTLSKELNLYRQTYCGCQYSIKK